MVKAITVRDLDRADGSISMVLSFQVDEFQAIRRGMYTAILTSQGAPRGEAGDPALPWRKLLVYVPDGASSGQAKFTVRRATQWLSGVPVEPIQPEVPISESELVKPVGPNSGVYRQSDVWPEQPGHAVAVRRLGEPPTATRWPWVPVGRRAAPPASAAIRATTPPLGAVRSMSTCAAASGVGVNLPTSRPAIRGLSTPSALPLPCPLTATRWRWAPMRRTAAPPALAGTRVPVRPSVVARRICIDAKCIEGRVVAWPMITESGA